MTPMTVDSKEQGTALGALVVMLTLLAILTVGVTRMVARRLGAARQVTARLQAQYAAESGIEALRWRLAHPGGWQVVRAAFEDSAAVLHESVAVGTAYTLRLRPYGGYLEATVTGRCAKARVTIRALLGMQPPAWFQRAVTVRRSPYLLVLAGASRIRGDLLVGPNGVQTGRIPGDPLPPQEPPVEGTILRQGEPVEFDPWLVETTMTRCDQVLAGNGSPPPAADLDGVESRLTPMGLAAHRPVSVLHLPGPLTLLTAEPTDPPLVGPLTLVADGAVHLRGALTLQGPVVIAAQESIWVTDQVVIRGGLLYSPGPIRLTEEAQLEGQALSRSRIEVADQAQVRYPGMLYATGTLDRGRLDGWITITSQRLQTGSLLVQRLTALGGHPALDRTTVRIARHSRVAGFLYSANATWLNGELIGAVATGTFYLEHGLTTYLNWIQDGVIDRRPLTDAFRLPLGFGAQPQVEVVAWERNDE